MGSQLKNIITPREKIAWKFLEFLIPKIFIHNHKIISFNLGGIYLN